MLFVFCAGMYIYDNCAICYVVDICMSVCLFGVVVYIYGFVENVIVGNTARCGVYS